MGWVLCWVVLGQAARRFGLETERWVPWLNAWVLRVALPAVVLRVVPGLHLEPALAAPALAPWLVLGGAVLVFGGAGRALGWPRSRIAGLALTAGLGNTSFAGLPLLAALVGPPALGPGLVADQVGSFLALASAGLALAAWGAGQAPGWRPMVARLMRFPPAGALVLALLLRASEGLPSVLDAPLALVGSTLAPVALFSVGAQLALGALMRRRDAGLALLAAGLTWKLLAAPLLVLALMGREGLPAQVAVLQAGMAPMVTAGIVAREHNLEPELAPAMVGLGLLLSLLTLPLLAHLVGA